MGATIVDQNASHAIHRSSSLRVISRPQARSSSFSAALVVRKTTNQANSSSDKYETCERPDPSEL